jgi:hypothetical protein
MTRETVADQRQRFTGRAIDTSRAVLTIVAEDVRTWDVFSWLVLTLLVLNLIFLLSLAGLKSEIAALKEERGASALDLAAISKELADTRAALTQAITGMRSGLHDDIVKLNAELAARAAQQQLPTPAAAAAPAPKPGAKPRP